MRAHDFVETRTQDGRKIRMLNVVDAFTHECLAIRVARKLKTVDVIDMLSDLFSRPGVPGHINSDNEPKFDRASVPTMNRTRIRIRREAVPMPALSPKLDIPRSAPTDPSATVVPAAPTATR